MGKLQEAQNKVLVLEAFDALFNQRDYAAAARLLSRGYVQHSPRDPKLDREGLINLIKSLPPTLKYEAETIVAYDDFVILHGKFSGVGEPRSWIAADIVRVENGALAEHWDASTAR
jgi:predicted SnoaL-like aldol condensation-catalyzing enzyme